ncbi:MAG TPA: MFS transporter [Gemmatimonadaceae bacterium]|nr:MFS transporter [Gemmatimonadaceae bacterium]
MANVHGPRARDSYAAFRIPNYGRFIVSLLTMTLGAQIQAIVVSWQIYQVTRDPLALGLVGLAEVIPYVSVALVAGHVVDRGNRRRISLWSLSVLLGAAVLLFILSLIWPVPRVVWPYYVIIAVCGLARSFLQSARSPLIAELVPREIYANAATWRSSTWQLASVVGPALGGLSYAAFGARLTFGMNLLFGVAALASMWLIRHVPPPRALASASLMESLTESWHFLRRQPVILGALTLDMFAVFFGGATALLPIFADRILNVGPQGLGFLQAAPGAGAVLMAFVIAHRGPFERAGRTLLTVVTIFGICMIGFALSRTFWLSFVFLFISGAADNVSAVIRSTLLQILVPSALLGRVSSVNAIFIGSSNELGAFESGVAAKLLGVVPSVVFGGLMTLAVVSAVGWRVPALRRLREIALPPEALISKNGAAD